MIMATDNSERNQPLLSGTRVVIVEDER